MSATLPPEGSFPMQRVSTVSVPPNFFSQPPDAHSTHASHSGRKKSSVSAPPPLSPLQSPPPTMNYNSGTVLCRPYRHASEADIIDSLNNVELNNSHERVSFSQFNEPVPPPKPPRRASANPRMMEYSLDVVNGNRSNTTSPEPGAEEPPPIPVKKKNKKTLG